MKKLILLLCLLPLCAVAGEWGVQVHVMSNTFSNRDGAEWNSSTDGFALRYTVNEALAFQTGHYRNEFTVKGYNFFTNYAGGDYTPWRVGPANLGGYGWIVSGYNEHALAPSAPARIAWEKESGLQLSGGLVARLDYGQFNLLLRARPALPGVPGAVMSEVGWRFK